MSQILTATKSTCHPDGRRSCVSTSELKMTPAHRGVSPEDTGGESLVPERREASDA